MEELCFEDLWRTFFCLLLEAFCVVSFGGRTVDLPPTLAEDVVGVECGLTLLAEKEELFLSIHPPFCSAIDGSGIETLFFAQMRSTQEKQVVFGRGDQVGGLGQRRLDGCEELLVSGQRG